VLDGEQEVARLLRAAPHAFKTRSLEDELIVSIPHWLYREDTPLHLAAAALKADVARTILACGADPNAVNRRGATPLHYACDARPKSAGTWNLEAQIAMITVLVERGAELDRGDSGGATPLHRAVRSRSVAAVKTLLALGARADVRLRTRGSTPLHLAAQSTGAGGTAGSLDLQLDIIDVLLEEGADADAVDNSGRTARDWAKNPHVRAALGARRA